MTAGQTAATKPPAVTPTAGLSTLGDDALPGLPGKKDEEAVFPARSRLIEAAGNKTMQEIFNFLGDPKAALVFQDKPILFGVATVSANPGWRTRRDYDGQVDVNTTYQWAPARIETLRRIVEQKEEFPPGIREEAQFYLDNGHWRRGGTSRNGALIRKAQDLDKQSTGPLVVAVSPLMERQAIDMSSSRARQSEIALFLSASLARAGLKAQGEVFNKFVKLQREDVATRSVLPVLNAYNTGGGLFGFQFGPRLDAVDNPGGKNPKPAKQLSKQSFPVLLMCGFTKTDIAPQLAIYGDELRIYEPEIKLVQTTRWSRQQKRGAFHSGLRSVVFPGFPGRPMQSPSSIYGDLREVGRKFTIYKPYIELYALEQCDVNVDSWLEKVEADMEVMNSAYFGYTNTVALPVDVLVGPAPAEPASPKAAPHPVIAAVFPQRLEVTRVEGASGGVLRGRMLIGGQDLDQVDLAAPPLVLPEGAASAVRISDLLTSAGKSALAYEVTFDRAARSVQLALPLRRADDSAPRRYVYTPLMEVAARFDPPPGIVATPEHIDITERRFSNAPQGRDAQRTRTLFLNLRVFAQICVPTKSKRLRSRCSASTQKKLRMRRRHR